MNRSLQLLGSLVLIVIGLYLALAVLDVGIEISRDIWYWVRYDLLPGLMWAVGIGFVLLLGWNLISRNGEV